MSLDFLKEKRAWVLLAYIFTAVYLLPMFPHGGSANELSRWATAASLVERGSFEITWTEALIGTNADTAKIGNSTYSNKAPGPAMIAAPIYALTRLFIGPPNASNIRVSWYAMRLFISTLPLVLIAVWMFRRGVDEYSMAALLFGTPLFLYSLLLFSHVMAAALLYTAFRLLFDQGEFKPLRYAAAGMICGLAVISEFPAFVAVVVFGIGLLLTDRALRFARVTNFVAGGFPFVIFLLIYNNSLFGSPFSLSYAHESFPEWAEIAGQGVFGIGIPTLSNANLLLLSPSRGLFFFSPLLILSVIAIYRTFDVRDIRRMVRSAVILLTFLLICGHGAAHGGWAIGPSYLVLIIPFLLDPFFEGDVADLPKFLVAGLFGASFLLSIVPALTFPFAPPEFVFPHNDFSMALMTQMGWYVPTLLDIVVFGSGGLSILPVVLAAILVLTVAANYFRASKRALAGLTIGLGVVFIYLFVPGLDQGDRPAFRRSMIAERYFRQDDRMTEAASSAAVRNDVERLREINVANWVIADARANAPDDFPYSVDREMTPSPSTLMRLAISLQMAGKVSDAERAYIQGKNRLPFARCDFSTNLAVLYFTNNRKQDALNELESVRPLVDQASRPSCMRSLFLLASLYGELGRDNDARDAAQQFQNVSSRSTDPEIVGMRKKLTPN